MVQGSHKNLIKKFHDFSIAFPGQIPNFQTQNTNKNSLNISFSAHVSIYTINYRCRYKSFNQSQPNLLLIEQKLPRNGFTKVEIQKKKEKKKDVRHPQNMIKSHGPLLRDSDLNWQWCFYQKSHTAMKVFGSHVKTRGLTASQAPLQVEIHLEIHLNIPPISM